MIARFENTCSTMIYLKERLVGLNTAISTTNNPFGANVRGAPRRDDRGFHGKGNNATESTHNHTTHASCHFFFLNNILKYPPPLQVLYGFLSDCVPINGERRKPYLMLGWFFYLISNLALAAMGEPSIPAVIFFVFLMTSAYMLADVMTDALIVERSRYESRKGDLQSRGYIIRFFGSTIGAGETTGGGRGEKM